MASENERTEHAKTCAKCRKRIPFPLWYNQRRSERFRQTNEPLCATCIAKWKLKNL